MDNGQDILANQHKVPSKTLLSLYFFIIQAVLFVSSPSFSPFCVPWRRPSMTASPHSCISHIRNVSPPSRTAWARTSETRMYSHGFSFPHNEQDSALLMGDFQTYCFRTWVHQPFDIPISSATSFSFSPKKSIAYHCISAEFNLWMTAILIIVFKLISKRKMSLSIQNPCCFSFTLKINFHLGNWRYFNDRYFIIAHNYFRWIYNLEWA